jgi:hypothetical protein
VRQLFSFSSRFPPENETEVSFFNDEAFELFRQNPEVCALATAGSPLSLSNLRAFQLRRSGIEVGRYADSDVFPKLVISMQMNASLNYAKLVTQKKERESNTTTKRRIANK